MVAFGLAVLFGSTLLPAFDGVGNHLADGAGYLALARSLADEGDFRLEGDPASWVLPLYPAILSLFLRLADPLAAIQMFQVLLWASIVFPVWLLLRDRLPEAHALAALLLSLAPSAVFLSPFVLGPEVLFYAIFAWWLLAGARALDARGPAWCLAWGFLSGLAALTSAAGVRLLPLVLVALAAGRLARVRPAGVPRALGAVSFSLALFGLVASSSTWFWIEWSSSGRPVWADLAGQVGPRSLGPRSLAWAGGILVLGSGILPLPAALGALWAKGGATSRSLALLVVLSAVALGLGPAESGPCPLAALFPIVIAVAYPHFGKPAIRSHFVAVLLVVLFVAAFPGSQLGTFGGVSLSPIAIGAVLIWLVVSGATLGALGARRTLVALATIALVLPNLPRIAQLAQAVDANRSTLALGGWLERHGAPGPVILLPSRGRIEPETIGLARAIQAMTGRRVLLVPDPSAVLALVSPDRAPHWRPLARFDLAPEGPQWLLYPADQIELSFDESRR